MVFCVPSKEDAWFILKTLPHTSSWCDSPECEQLWKIANSHPKQLLSALSVFLRIDLSRHLQEENTNNNNIEENNKVNNDNDFSNDTTIGDKINEEKEKEIAPLKLILPNPVPHHQGTNPVMASMLYNFDWTKTDLGPREAWSPSLVTAVDIVLSAHFPLLLCLGEKLYLVYNDYYAHVLGPRHPAAFGQPCRDVWGDVFHAVEPFYLQVLHTGEPVYFENSPFFFTRYGYLEEAYLTWSYSMLRDSDGKAIGVFCPIRDTTGSILTNRRLQLLRSVLHQTADAPSRQHACEQTAEVFKSLRIDITFSLIYLFDDKQEILKLCASDNIISNECAPEEWRVGTNCVWPFQFFLDNITNNTENDCVEVKDLDKKFGISLPSGFPEAQTTMAVMLPIMSTNNIQGMSTNNIQGILVLGTNPRRAFDKEYKDFFTTLAQQLSRSLLSAYAAETERQRLESLAELDRAKTNFFSNISHELRTPLTLVLSPLEDILAIADITPDLKNRLTMVFRNAQRLLKLVNTLLDFSRIESGRMQAHFVPTNISQLTTDYASMFRAAIEKAGLVYNVECPPLGKPLYVDIDMWQNIEFNLLSNALKYTREGSVSVNLCEEDEGVALYIKDTGVGIPEEEIQEVFDRFHRVEGVVGRSYEGTGIGLALTQELVFMHGGKISLTSTVDVGTTFKVYIPYGTAHLAPEMVGDETEGDFYAASSQPKKSSQFGQSKLFLDEAMSWVDRDDDSADSGSSAASDRSNGQPSNILVADDNPDMRRYISLLLSSKSNWAVKVVCNGRQALESALVDQPDIILSDVMMPVMDGFEFMEALHQDNRTCHIPVILLSARAGEEAKIEGLQAGAADYLVKPFSAKEFMARVTRQLELAHKRGELKSQVDERTNELAAALDQIQASERDFRLLANTLPVGIMKCDMSGTIMYANSSWYDIVGIEAIELSCDVTAWMQRVHPDDSEVLNNWMQSMQNIRASAGAQLFKVDCRFIHSNGSVKCTIMQSMPQESGYVTAFTDVTHERRLENDRVEALQLAESEQRARALQAEAHQRAQELFVDMICHEIRNPLNGILQNSDLLASSMRTQMKALLAQCHAEGFDQNSALYNERLLTLNNDSEAVHSIEMCANHQLAITNDVIEISKLDAGQVQFNIVKFSPAQVVYSALQMFKVSLASKGIAHEVIVLPARGQESFCGDNYVGWGDPSRIKQILINLLVNAVKFTQLGAEKRITVTLKLEKPGAEKVQDFINQNQGNTHRREKSSDNELALSARCCKSPPPLHGPPDTIMSLSVQDTGVGMSDEEQKQLFRRFTQGNKHTYQHYGGSGLGLYISKTLAHLMGGQIYVYSEMNKGSIFTLVLALAHDSSSSTISVQLPHNNSSNNLFSPTTILPTPLIPTLLPTHVQTHLTPLTIPQEPTNSTPPVTPSSTNSNNKNILIVEDNPVNQRVLYRHLAAAGYIVTLANNGKEGVDKFFSGFVCFDLIFMDIEMPVMNGLEATKKIRETEQEQSKTPVPIIGLSGNARQMYQQEGFDAGMMHFIVKPYDKKDLLSIVNQYIGLPPTPPTTPTTPNFHSSNAGNHFHQQSTDTTKKHK